MTDDPPLTYSGMHDVVKRGDVKEFADMNVEKAMKINKSSGKWPVAEVSDLLDDIPYHAPAPQYWDAVVKKGNEEFNDKAVDMAMKLKDEPIVINGKIMPASEDPPLDPYE